MKSRKFKIAGQNWKLKVLKKHPNLDDSWGFNDSDNNIIYIDAKAPPDQQISTFLHEVLHCIEYVYDINLTERQIKCLEAGLFSVFDIKLRR